MRMWGPIEVFDRDEEDRIHDAMLEILAETGVIVENEGMLERLAEFGVTVSKDDSRVTFPRSFVEDFIAGSETFDWRTIAPKVRGGAGIYFGNYLDPEDDAFKPWTIQRLLAYFKVAHHLPNVEGYVSLPVPVEDIPREHAIPFIHYLSFMLHGRCASDHNSIEWAPMTHELCRIQVQDTGEEPSKAFRGAVYMISPLRLARDEAAIFTYFAERGLRVSIGHQSSAGGAAPVTLAGALTIHLAQGMFINIIKRAWFCDKTLSLTSSIAPLDMRSGFYPYGRPEQEMCNVAMAQLARRYGARFHGHCGHSDAPRPGVESGFQKAMTSIPTLLCCGETSISCGLLASDVVFSPEQMIIDNEMVGAMKRFVRGFEVNENTLASEVIKEAGPGGTFLDKVHTARNFREELWEPGFFTRFGFAHWMAAGARTEAEIAREIFRDIIKRDAPPSRLSPQADAEMRGAIEKFCGVKLDPIELV